MPRLNSWNGGRSDSSLTYVYVFLSWLLLLGKCPGGSSQTAAATAAGVQLGVTSCISAPTDLRIPRIIHRNYMEGRSAMYAATQVDNPSWQLHWLLSCKAHHPTWAEMVWSEEDILGLIIEAYPWFLSTYLTYSKHVFRSDLARFVILHKHGGVYLDADVECYKNMEPSLAGLDLVLNCRTYDVAHNAAMASIAGHPVWIEAMKAAMAVVQRLKPVVSTDPLTATGPVLMSQAVQQYYGITKEQFCDRLHWKGGLVLKAYPKGQWFTPCWPWANLLCYKKLETERKFIVRSDPNLGQVVGVHHYSGTWFGQASNSKDKLRQRNRMLAAEATVSFLWNSPHFVEYKCSPKAAAAAAAAAGMTDSSTVALDSSSNADSGDASSYASSSSSLKQKLVHKRPGLVSAAEAGTTTSSTVVRKLRRMLGAQQSETHAPAAAGRTAVEPQTLQVLSVSQEAGTPVADTLLSCPEVRQLASMQPCMVLSVAAPTPIKQSTAAGQQASDTSSSTSTSFTSSSNSSSNSSSRSAYWANVDSMLSSWQHSLGCHVTVAATSGTEDAPLTSKLVQLASGKAAAHGRDLRGVSEWSKRPQHTFLPTQQDVMTQQQQQQQPGGAAQLPAAATFVELPVEGMTGAATEQPQGPDAAQLLAQLLQQQRQQQLHALGCDDSSARHKFPPQLTCKAPPRHTALHLSCSADFLLNLAEQMYSYNARVRHAELEQHGRYSGAMHTIPHDLPLVVNSSSGSSKLQLKFSNNGPDSAQRVVTILDTIDILLFDVERPSGPTAHMQGWSVLHNLLYQLHGYVGFYRKALPDSRTRLGWIRRPERLDRLACTALH